MNPILWHRKTQRLTQAQLAGRLGTSIQTIRRAEQGTFNSLPPALHPIADADTYEEWRITKRNNLRGVGRTPVIVTPPFAAVMGSTPVGGHPLYTLRRLMMLVAKEHGIIRPTIDETSVAGFAKLVAIDPETITECEASYQAPGPHIRHLLGDLGYNQAEIGELRRKREGQ